MVPYLIFGARCVVVDRATRLMMMMPVCAGDFGLKPWTGSTEKSGKHYPPFCTVELPCEARVQVTSNFNIFRLIK